MKPVTAFIMIISLILLATGCAAVQKDMFDIEAVKSYRDIPGVTEDEIAAIEALKAERESFSYGHLMETEAFILPDGARAGFTTKLCGLLTELFGIAFVQEFHDWDSLKNGIDNRLIDFTGELTPTPEQMRLYHMSHPIAERSLSIFTHTGSPEITGESDINGLKVGFLAGSMDRDLVKEYYPLLSIKAVDVGSFAAAAALLKTGGIDVFVTDGVVDPFFDKYDYIRSKEFFPLIYNPVSMATANPELGPFISVVSKYIEAGGIGKLYELYKEGGQEYTRYKFNSSLTGEEKAYLNGLESKNAKVKIALETDNYPVSFYNDKDKEFQGIAVDILTEISELTGIEFDAVTGKDIAWSEILERLRAGDVSMVSQLLYSDERKNDFIWTDVPYATSRYALLSKIDYPNLASYQVTNAKVGVVRKTAHEDMYKLWFPENGNVIYYDTQNDALDALERGEIDLLMASEHRLLAQINYREKPEYKANILFSTPMESFFGFPANERVLCSIINKTQPYVKTDLIERDWMSRFFDYSRKYTVRFNALLLIFTAVLSAALISVIFLWRKNQRFRRDLERKTVTLSTIFMAIPDILYSKDVNNRYTGCNTSFEKLAGLKESEIIGKSVMEVFASTPNSARYDMAVRFSEMDERLFVENATQKAVDCYIFPDGTRRLFESIKTPLIQNGETIGLMGISRDVTEYRAAMEAAQAASRAKSSFLTQMSHEILTPMNAIIGMTELVMREKIPPTIQAYVKSIRHASDNLLSIINDILDFSKIDAGNLEIIAGKYSFASLINDVLVIIRMRLRERHVLFTANIDCNIPKWLIGDDTRVRQILLNILGNAVKYTHDGYVSLAVDGKIEGDELVLTARISDSGVGIKEEDIENLFDNFTRFDGVENKSIRGTGLGLSNSKNLCLAMGGDISVQSVYGVGSTFTVTIPQKIISLDERLAHVSNPGEKRVLVYEARSIYADSIARSFANLGVRCDIAAGQTEFYEKIKSVDYAFIFIPSKFSANAGQALGELGLSERIVLMMELGEAITTLATGDVKSIAMPIYSVSIANILNNDVNDNISYNESLQVYPRFVAPTANVLVVDDLKTNLRVAEGLLMPYQMCVDVCKSGAEAASLVRKNQYDIIFMDHMMPEMDGMKTTKLIRSMEGRNGYYKKVPIIALTANAASGAKEMLLKNGMNDLLTKPIDIAKLNSLLKKWIPSEKKQKYRGVKKSPPPVSRDSSSIHIEGVDVEAGIAMTGGDLDNYLKTLSIFHMDGSDKASIINDCLEKNDIKLYTTYVHSLKSATASLGANEISDFAKSLEMAGINGDTQFIRENTGRFLAEFETLLGNISSVLEKGQGGAESEHDSALLVNELARLKKALESRDAGEIDDIMEILAATNWTKEDDEIFKEASKNIYLFNYSEAAALIGRLLAGLG